MSIINRLILKFERLIRARLEVPVNLRNGRLVVLASFPKSGNTWMRFAVSDILANKKGRDDVDFHSIRQYSPEIRGNRTLDGIVLDELYPTFLKTHFYFLNGFSKYRKVLLFRDPVKCLVSYYDYLASEQDIHYSSFDKFLDSPRHGIDAWIYFHETWINKSDVIVDYDVLIKNQELGLKAVYRSLGIELPESVLVRAMKRSSREAMRKKEVEYGDPCKVNQSYEFVGNAPGRHEGLGVTDASVSRIVLRTSELYSQLKLRAVKV